MSIPIAPDAEKAVLSAVISSGGTALTEMDFLKPEHFSDPTNATIFELVRGIYEGGGKPDAVVLSEQLRDSGIPPQILDEYTSVDVREPGAVRDYASIVLGKWRAREIIRISEEAAEAAHSGIPERVLDDLERQLIELRPSDKSGLRRASFGGFLQRERGTHSVESGYSPIDSYLGGLGAGRLITIASRPGVGKTTLALNIAANAAGVGRAVAFFSLEMSEDELVERFIARESRITSAHLKNREGLTMDEWSHVKDTASRVDTWDLFIDDTPTVTAYEIGARAKKLRHEKGLDLIIVDYLQLMNATSSDSREQEIASMTRALKLLAKELSVPVIAMSQLNRQAEIRGGKPRQSDLRESGSIENDSDQILFLWREDEDSGDATRTSYTNVWVGKNRHGPTGDFQLTFLPNQSRFE